MSLAFVAALAELKARVQELELRVEAQREMILALQKPEQKRQTLTLPKQNG